MFDDIDLSGSLFLVANGHTKSGWVELARTPIERQGDQSDSEFKETLEETVDSFVDMVSKAYTNNLHCGITVGETAINAQRYDSLHFQIVQG